MKKIDIVRAWKDPVYRATLRAKDPSLIPSHPAGLVEISDEDLKRAAGLAGLVLTTAQTCTEFTFRQWRRCCPK